MKANTLFPIIKKACEEGSGDSDVCIYSPETNRYMDLSDNYSVGFLTNVKNEKQSVIKFSKERLSENDIKCIVFDLD